MSKGIKMSPKHGFNPSVDHCFHCGKDIGVILFGALKGDAEAPRSSVSSFIPCDDCMEILAKEQKINLIVMGADNQPTGDIITIAEGAFAAVFKRQTPPKRVALVDTEVMRALQDAKKEALEEV